MARFALLIVLLLSLAACRDESRLGILDVTGRVFIFNPRNATATAVVTLAVRKPQTQEAVVELTMENPAGGEPIIMRQPLKPLQQQVSFETEPLLCIVKDKRYGATVVLRDGKGEEMQKIETSLVSTLDQYILPPAPLVVGPGYDANPELKNMDAGAVLRKRAAACGDKSISANAE